MRAWRAATASARRKFQPLCCLFIELRIVGAYNYVEKVSRNGEQPQPNEHFFGQLGVMERGYRSCCVRFCLPVWFAA
jgi:hypothetical protein